MHGGLPPSDAFPFKGFDCLLSNTDSNIHSSQQALAAAAVHQTSSSDSVADDAVLHVTDPVQVTAAQQYNFHVKVGTSRV